MADRIVRASTFLSYVLRHNPGALDLTLAPGGWADIDTLLERARAEGRALDRPLLNQVLDHGDKERFSVSADGTMIRANYGHSVAVALDVSPTRPPPHLYHGTAQQALSAIQNDGLRPQSRQYVHLSRTEDEALRVGRRHGLPVVLIVAARDLHNAGHALYRPTDAVWLTARVPPRFLQVAEDA